MLAWRTAASLDSPWASKRGLRQQHQAGSHGNAKQRDKAIRLMRTLIVSPVMTNAVMCRPNEWATGETDVPLGGEDHQRIRSSFPEPGTAA